ncbi:hypothetical protein [uncultured Hymenobacter sp.]|uniref:hypothetical protein n=1 Tax=uncultured Hymenobacter sp. TaxID=170016 RepID=UPI0035CC542F
MKPAVSSPADPLAQLTEIRAIMERSSRFISLSGLSGVGAGVVALVGAAGTHFYFQERFGARGEYEASGFGRLLSSTLAERLAALPFLLALAAAMIAAALLLAVFFTVRRTRRDGRPVWNGPARRLALALVVPLVAGGLFCLRLYLSGAVELVVPGLLLFYGLALLNGSKYTLDEIRWLGLTEIGLGLLGLLLPGYGLVLFAAGFGLGHIGYGLLMYNHYERAGAALVSP